ncbi:hypothetical protein D3C75_1246220 [compost metagenome]
MDNQVEVFDQRLALLVFEMDIELVVFHAHVHHLAHVEITDIVDLHAATYVFEEFAGRADLEGLLGLDPGDDLLQRKEV